MGITPAPTAVGKPGPVRSTPFLAKCAREDRSICLFALWCGTPCLYRRVLFHGRGGDHSCPSHALVFLRTPKRSSGHAGAANNFAAGRRHADDLAAARLPLNPARTSII